MIKGEVPPESASLVERVRWLVEHEINPQLAQHRGNVALEEVTADGVVVLRFGGGCHGCGMVAVTLKQGIAKTLREKVPGVTARSEEHTSDLQSLMRTSYAVFCLKKKTINNIQYQYINRN